MPTVPTKDAVGRFGEDLAAVHLERIGLEVLARNWRCPRGELDIVAREDRCLVVVEVKTRRSLDFGHPAEAVGWSKQARLRRLAAEWLQGSAGRFDEVRIDVVAVFWPRQGPPRLEHLRGVC